MYNKRGSSTLALLTVALTLTASIYGTWADDRKNATGLIISRGFNVDEYDVISQDYVLKVYRIINPLADPKKLHKIPIVATHGVSFDVTSMMSASSRSRPRKPSIDERVTLYSVQNGTDDRGLYFYLSNNNYDVWLLEARATNERNRKKLTSETKRFWDFSLDEQALVDLPAQINFILNKTEAKKCAYIAYSQSTTLMFGLLSMNPNFSEKLAAFIAVAPVVYTHHLKGVTFPIANTNSLLAPIASVESFPELFRKYQNLALTYLCSVTYIKYTFCRFIWKEFSGPDNKARLDGGMVENPLKSTSFKSFEQFVNNAKLKDFRMYDYHDEKRNIEEYGQPVPPAYNVSAINLRSIVLFRGTEDYLSTPADQMVLMNRLKVPLYEDHIVEDYAHIDFIVSPTVTIDVNEPILRVVDELTNRTVSRTRHNLYPEPQVQVEAMIDVRKDLQEQKSQGRLFATAKAQAEVSG